MLFLRLWNYIRGYVIILVEGYFLEKFINICTHRQIYLWDIERLKGSSMRLKVSIKGFRLLRPVAKKTGCRVKIVKKNGLPFGLSKYRKRKAFLVGTVFFAALLYIMTSFIWTIEITGNKNVNTNVILEKLYTLGVKPGVMKYKIDANKLSSNIMLNMNQLAWVSVNIRGTKMKVEVAERIEPPRLIKSDVVCNIIANKDGVVKSVIAKSGEQLVKAGDTVTKGQILISGAVEIKDNDKTKTTLVHAIGLVKARTWYEGRCPVKTVMEEKKRTGREKNTYSIVLFTKRIDLKWGQIPFKSYEKDEDRKKLSFGKDYDFPFEFVIDKYYESETNQKEISIDEAKSIAMDKAYDEAMKNIKDGVEVVNTNQEFIEGENGTEASAVVECVEEIGEAKEIGGE